MIVLLSPTPFDGVHHMPIIKQNFLSPKLDLMRSDAVIFTSKQAVKALDRISSEWKKLKIFSVGSGTSETIRSHGAEVFYEASDFYGDTLAKEIATNYPKFRYFYPRAKEVVSHLEEILMRSGVEVTSAIVYETVCNPIDMQTISKNATIIFTAPSTVKCFFAQTSWQNGFKAVAIGTKTEDELVKFAPCVVAKEPTIKSAVELATSLTARSV